MATTQQNSGALYNALTAGSKIIGTIVTDSDMRVDGTIEGDVNVKVNWWLVKRVLFMAMLSVRMPM